MTAAKSLTILPQSIVMRLTRITFLANMEMNTNVNYSPMLKRIVKCGAYLRGNLS